MGLLTEDRPRRHHYLFAHRDLLEIARRFPAGLPGLAGSGRMDEALTMTWERIGGQLPEGEALPHDGLHATRHDLAGQATVLVTLPRAEHSAEAHFVAIVPVDDQPPGYFVLEHGWGVQDEPRTVLCRWDESGHVNLGDGPPPDAEAFLAAVAVRLAAGRES